MKHRSNRSRREGNQPPAISNRSLAVVAVRIATTMFAVCCWQGLANGQIVLPLGAEQAELWRQAQLEAVRQLRETASGPLAEELECQQQWLDAWKPGELKDRPILPAKNDLEVHPEPIIDPSGLATPLRRKLLAPDASPTLGDTQELKLQLQLHPTDLGLRQLHLHWLDQSQFRKKYADRIADAALWLARQLAAADESSDAFKWAQAWCWYRAGRALAYRELPDVVAENPIGDPGAHDAKLRSVANRLNELCGDDRPEFVLLRVRMLRRDGYFGRALVDLEQHGEQIDKKWLLKKRRDLLRELKWEPAAAEAARVYARYFPDEAAKEAVGLPSGDAQKGDPSED